MTTYTLTVSTNALGFGVISGARVIAERKRTQVTDIFNGRSISTNSTATNSSGIATILLEPDDGSVYHELKIFDLAGILVYSKIFIMPPQAVSLADLPVQDIISASATQAVNAAAIAVASAEQTELDAAATAADVESSSENAAAAIAAAESIIVATKKFSTYAEQMAYTGDYIDGQKCDVLSYYALGDGGFIPMYWSASSTAVHNVGTVRQPTSVVGAGRWLAINPNNINVRQFGAFGNGSTNDTEYFQNAINFAADNGLIVNVPKGNYAIFTTVTLKEGVSLIGEKTNPHNAAVYYPSIIRHLPTSSNVNVFESETPPTPTTYVSCGAVENIFIIASPLGYTKYGLFLQNPIGARFKNIGAWQAFTDGFLAIKGSLNCEFSNFRVSNTTTSPMAAAVSMLSYDGEIYSTTTIFDNFYVSGTLSAGTGGLTAAFLALPAAGVGIAVKNWIVESITGIAFNVKKGNEIRIIAPYIENIPNANVSTPLIEIGVSGAAAPNNAFDTITSLTFDGQGSKIQQYTQGAATNTVFINADVAQFIIVKDIQLARCIKFIAGTNNTQRLKISNIQAASVTTFQTGMTAYKIEEGDGCFFGTSTYVAGSVNYELDATKNSMPKSLLKNAGLFISSDIGTEGALSWLDRADNQFNYTAIKYPSSPINGAWKIGDVVVNSAPAIGRAMGWAATENGSGDAANWVIRGQFGIASGVTASRPTKTTMGVSTDARWAGTQYLDTTLAANGRLITWTGALWVDYNGTSV